MVVIIDPPSGLPIPRRTDRAPRNKRRGRVPRPEDIRQVTAETLRDPGLHATPEDFGAGIARAVEDLGMKAAGIALAFDEKRRQAEDDTAGIAGLADARMRFNKVARSMEAQADKADGFTANLGPALAAETDAILRDLRDVRGLRHSQRAEDAIRTQLHMLASRMVARGAKFEHGARLSQLGIEVDAAVRDLAMAAFNSPGDWPAIMEETEARLARFKDKLPPDILAAKVAAARGMIAANAAAGLIELDPALARQELKAGLFDDELPAAERKRLRVRAKAAVRDRRAQAELGQIENRATAAADGARRLVALEGAIGRGEAGEQAIAEAADILDDPTRARLHERLDAGRADDAARNRRIEKVSAVLAGRAPATGEGDGKPDGGGVKDGDLRPGAPEWPQAVDDHYASLSDTLETMDPDERARFEDDYARATGVLPGAVAKRLRGGLLSADPAEQAAAATHLVRLKDVDPALFSVIPAVERRRAQAIAEFVDLGLTPARAVELAEKKLAQRVLPSADPIGSEDGEGGEENGNDAGGKDEPTGTQLAQLSAPGQKARPGGLPLAVSPVPNPKMRHDLIGSGAFGASRGGGTRKHLGVDLEAPAGSPVRSPVDGVVEKIGDPYRKGHRLHGQFNTIWIRTKTGFRVKMFYVNPQDRNGNPLVKPGDIVSAGQPIGTMQDRARHDKGMINHLHLEIKGGKGLRTAIDPAPRLKKWGVK